MTEPSQAQVGRAVQVRVQVLPCTGNTQHLGRGCQMHYQLSKIPWEREGRVCIPALCFFKLLL